MYAFLIILGLVVIQAVWTVVVYNKFVQSKLLIENNFSQIKIQCKKRFDLIPNLVETVKGFAEHEKETLENVIQARNIGISADNPEALANANTRLTQTLGKLFALSEAYPDIKANSGFITLHQELVSLEKAIAVSRQLYNDSVMMYNRKIMVFPNSIFAFVFRFYKAAFFDTPDDEMQNVDVKFN